MGGGGGVTYLNLGCRCRACIPQRFLNPDPLRERENQKLIPIFIHDLKTDAPLPKIS